MINNNYYLRIGELPRDGKSKIYQWDDIEHSSKTVVGEELGVSVYNIEKIKNKWRIVLPDNTISSTIDTFNYLTTAVKNGLKTAYIVSGEEIGKGYDGEPVITNIKIIKDITKNIKENNEWIDLIS